MKVFTIRQALEAVRGTYYGPDEALDRRISFVTSDSRTAKDGALFVAFKGARVDGHDFMRACIANGAACCLSAREPAADETPCIVVDDTLTAIGLLAKWHRARFDIPVIGVTGSVGKTTTKEMIAAVLSERFETHKTEKNFNNELGVPQTLLRLDEAHEVSVVEMGISSFGEMHYLADMVRPNVAVMTVIGDAHLEFLGDRQGVLRAKGEIFDFMDAEGLAVLNGDDALLKDYDPGCPRLTYGMNEGCDFRAVDVKNLGMGGLTCTICHHGASFPAEIDAYGIPTVYAALAAACVGWHMGMTDEEIARGLRRYQTVGDRARVIRTARYTVISDCYNANPNSVSAALESLRLLDGRKVCVLGDMLELGSGTKDMHYQTGRATQGMDLVLASGALSRETVRGAIDAGVPAQWFESRDVLADALNGLLKDGDNVLVKASHSMAFEEIVKSIEKMQ